MKELIIRKEMECDFYNTELMTRKAFWNLNVPGCDEHYLVHLMRTDRDCLPMLSRVAELDGKIVGCIMYAKGYIENDSTRHEIVTFGPLCVDPEFQSMGIGARLFRETAALAAQAGYPGIVIFGEPDYYPRLGFKTCDTFGITTAEGKNFSAFMAYELQEGAMAAVKGRYLEVDVYHNLSKEAVDEYDKKFPYLEKLRLPGQWDIEGAE